MKPGLLLKCRQIFWLTQTKFLLSIVLALLIFLVEYSAIIIHALERVSQQTTGVTGKKVSEYVLNFLRYLNDLPQADVVVTGLFWAVVGTMIYLALSSLVKLIISIRNEVVTDINYSKGSVVKVLITRLGAKTLAACAFVSLCAVSIFWLVPYWMAMMTIFVYSGFQLSSIGFLSIGFAGIVLNIYAVWAAAYFTWFYEENL